MQTFTGRQKDIMEAATIRISKYGFQNLTIKTLAEDIVVSVPVLYHHFKSKHDILLSLSEYFKPKMKSGIQSIQFKANDIAANRLRKTFNSQLQTFPDKTAMVNVVFAENILHFD